MVQQGSVHSVYYIATPSANPLQKFAKKSSCYKYLQKNCLAAISHESLQKKWSGAKICKKKKDLVQQLFINGILYDYLQKLPRKKTSFFWPLPKANWSWHFFNQEKNVQIVDRLLKLILKLSIFGAGKVFLLGGLPFVRLTFLHLTYKNLQKENKPVWLLAKILFGCPFANPQCAKKWSHTTIFKNLVWLLFLHLSSAYQLLEYQACKDWRRLTLWTNIHPSAADSSSI